MESSKNKKMQPEPDTDIVEENINVKFGETCDGDGDGVCEDNIKKDDLSKYTVVDADNLDEDDPIKGQEYCILSFMSPEGIMNCNVRAVKFRGAFPTLAAAEKYASELEKKEKYFKIFCGESGKWLDFDPPVSKVQREKSSNPQHQKILDNHAKHRMQQINELAGKTKAHLDKEDKGKKEKIDETKKAGAADDLVDKKRNKKKAKAKNGDEQETQTQKNNHGMKEVEEMRTKMRERLKERRAKKESQKDTSDKSNKQTDGSNLEKKIKMVGKISEELEEKKANLETAERNIAKIKKLMEERKKRKNKNGEIL